jgi:hypothetical protein
VVHYVRVENEVVNVIDDWNTKLPEVCVQSLDAVVPATAKHDTDRETAKIGEAADARVDVPDPLGLDIEKSECFDVVEDPVPLAGSLVAAKKIKNAHAATFSLEPVASPETTDNSGS